MSKPLLNKLNTFIKSDNFLELIKTFNSNTQVLLYLGYKKKGQYISIVRKYLYDNNIDTTHFIDSGKAAKPQLEKVCLVCNKKFTLVNNAKTQKQVTCSYSCSNTYFRSGENHPNWKNGRNYRERALSILGKECDLCGYDNLHALVVHHIDEDRSNNTIDNLIVLCANCHAEVHEGNYSKKHIK